MLLGRELLLLVQKSMSDFPAVMSLKGESDVDLDGGISLTTVSLMAQVDPSGWLRAMMFMFHHEMEIDEAAVVGYIKRRV